MEVTLKGEMEGCSEGHKHLFRGLLDLCLITMFTCPDFALVCVMRQMISQLSLSLSFTFVLCVASPPPQQSVS